MDFKTFRAAVVSKLILSNGKVTMPAAQLGTLDRYQRENFMGAGTNFPQLLSPLFIVEVRNLDLFIIVSRPVQPPP